MALTGWFHPRPRWGLASISAPVAVLPRCCLLSLCLMRIPSSPLWHFTESVPEALEHMCYQDRLLFSPVDSRIERGRDTHHLNLQTVVAIRRSFDVILATGFRSTPHPPTPSSLPRLPSLTGHAQPSSILDTEKLPLREWQAGLNPCASTAARSCLCHSASSSLSHAGDAPLVNGEAL